MNGKIVKVIEDHEAGSTFLLIELESEEGLYDVMKYSNPERAVTVEAAS